ncbi:MAG: nucleotidyltransferase domain-containing protein [Desulfuromonadales bacterium]|nr:nucleotidyltransferase domain-containing protein [Desulfuromonadales bacterium]
MTPSAPESTMDLSPKQLAEVRRILIATIPGCTVWAFGSRVNGSAKQYSDLDLVVLAPQPLALDILADLNEQFDESDLPFKVDLLDWATTSEAFRKIIQAERMVLWDGDE